MIEPSPELPSEPQRIVASGSQPDPIVLEDLVALIRLPGVFQRLRRVLDRTRLQFALPSDSPFRPLEGAASQGVLEYGDHWTDRCQLLRLFVGMSWGDQGHDPIWEVRVEANTVELADRLRLGNWHQLAARRAEARFSEWDRFWHEDAKGNRLLLGASAAATRFLEENDPEQTAADYLSGALYSLHASGALEALLAVALSDGEADAPPPREHGHG